LIFISFSNLLFYYVLTGKWEVSSAPLPDLLLSHAAPISTASISGKMASIIGISMLLKITFEQI
jgi:hypothetical protein